MRVLVVSGIGRCMAEACSVELVCNAIALHSKHVYDNSMDAPPMPTFARGRPREDGSIASRMRALEPGDSVWLAISAGSLGSSRDRLAREGVHFVTRREGGGIRVWRRAE